METVSQANDDRKTSYINHLAHIENIPNPEQIQYMSFAHSVAWSFNKEKKCKFLI
jgi:hypothetical protein